MASLNDAIEAVARDLRQTREEAREDRARLARVEAALRRTAVGLNIELKHVDFAAILDLHNIPVAPTPTPPARRIEVEPTQRRLIRCGLYFWCEDTKIWVKPTISSHPQTYHFREAESIRDRLERDGCVPEPEPKRIECLRCNDTKTIGNDNRRDCVSTVPCPDCQPQPAPAPAAEVEIRAHQHADRTWDVCAFKKLPQQPGLSNSGEKMIAHWSRERNGCPPRWVHDRVSCLGFFGPYGNHARLIAAALAANGPRPTGATP